MEEQEREIPALRVAYQRQPGGTLLLIRISESKIAMWKTFCEQRGRKNLTISPPNKVIPILFSELQR